jgi:hypothetical protein
VRLNAFILTVFVLTGCGSQPVGQTTDSSLRRKFESAIAREILSEVRRELHLLKGSTRAEYLQRKSKQLSASVDFTQVTSSIRLEHQLLDYLTRSERTKWQASEFQEKARALSSLNWSLAEYEDKILAEIDRLDQTIAAVAGDETTGNFSLERHINNVRSGADYPEDSYRGRQQYLDDLADTMIKTQLNWHAFFTRYEESALSIAGTESTKTSFNYNQGTLSISLAKVTDLPMFELRSIAAYYGFPGIQSFSTQDKKGSLSAVLELPGYIHGWAGYVLDYIAIRDVDRTLSYLYFSRLMAGLALADLRINTDNWSVVEAQNYLTTSTPYSANRIRLMLSKTSSAQGYYLAAVAGKLHFSTLRDRCPVESKACESVLHQKIVELGPLPFEILEQRLSALQLFTDNSLSSTPP